MAHEDVIVRYSEGRGVNLGKVKNQTTSWPKFCKLFEKPTVTGETRKQFDKMSKEQQDDLKAIDGFVMTARMHEGVRNSKNIMPRELISLDYDYPVALLDQIKAGVTPLSDYEFFVHTSRRHTPDAPRFRLFAPLSRSVTAEEYGPLSRIIAFIMEGEITPMKQVDKVSFRPAQMMFKPTISKDNEYVFYRNDGKLLDPDELFEWFRGKYGDYNDYDLLPRAADEDDLRRIADKAEDPTTKKGPVGDFCRAYDVIEAIDKFLPDTYARADDFSVKPRYTYLKGTSTSGAVVEDGGLFLYSHHGSDPTADMLVNAFDLVRIHMFGELDEGEPKDTPPTKWPSYKKMVEFIREDEGYRHSQAASRYDMAAMFEDMVDEDGDEDQEDDPAETAASIADRFDDLDDESSIDDVVSALVGSGAGSPADAPRKKKQKPKPPKDWFPDSLKMDQNGNLAADLSNAAIIIHNDARTFGAIAYNAFSKQIVARRSIKSRLEIAPSMIVLDTENGDTWQDFNDVTIRALLQSPNGEGKVGYGMNLTTRDLQDAILLTARRNEFHPIKDMLNDVAECYSPDVELVETLFVRYLGVEDNAYHREAAKWVLVASVARIYEPGHKFDFAPILQGQTGIRKSAFIKALYGEHYFGEIDCNLGDTQAIAEVISGIWGGELPELQGLHKADHNAAKAFMRRQVDKVRMAYDRRVSEHKRQMVVWGTTNDKKYLKDPTGNRSYWPIVIGIEEIDTDALSAERDRLWAAAVHIYRAMRAEKPKGELPLYLQSKEARALSTELQESARTEELHEIWANRIGEWADEPVTLAEFFAQIGLNPDESFEDKERSADKTLVVRCAFTREQAVLFGLKKDKGESDYQTVQNVGRALPEIEGWYQGRGGDGKTAKVRVAGLEPQRWHFREDATLTERKRGYRVVPVETDYSHLI